jgi:hypothetical protein
MEHNNMSNGKIKTIFSRRAFEWEEFLKKIIERIEENGYDKKLYKPEIERLILHHRNIKDIEKDIVDAFQGVDEVNKEVESWIKGKPINGDK